MALFLSIIGTPFLSIFPHSTKTVPFGSVTTYELCICIKFGFTKKRVLPLPLPPMTRIFLFLAYFGELGLPDIISLSDAVKMILFSNTGSIYGSISFAFPHLALPYSTPCLNFLAFFALKYTIRRKPTPHATPKSRSIGLKLGKGLAKASPSLEAVSISLGKRSPSTCLNIHADLSQKYPTIT